MSLRSRMARCRSSGLRARCDDRVVCRETGHRRVDLDLGDPLAMARWSWNLRIVDPARESYVPALSGWGVTPRRTLLIRPVTLQETCWVIEQCLRCRGVSVTLACLDKRLPMAVRRRWKMAAEVGAGVGVLFQTYEAKGEPVWADLRLRASPLPGGQGDTRRIKIDVLYRRGGIGGSRCGDRPCRG